MKEDPRSDADVISALRAEGQSHVFRWWDELDPSGRARLMEQLRSLDLEVFHKLIADVRAGRINPVPAGRPELPDYVRLPATPDEKKAREKARAAGEQLLRAGKVAAVMVAGGQGTRLGFDAPKGTFPIGPVSQRSLFQIHAERLLAARRRYGAAVPWYIMTSGATDAPTREYFQKHAWFGLPSEDVKFFQQRMMPALDRNFRLVLVAKDQILLSPNGHGGTLLALAENGMLDDMERRRRGDQLFPGG
jgi:UDP-N-acetylglucosamine/UDP-N-acetylgalactosamine diphosphorylase